MKTFKYNKLLSLIFFLLTLVLILFFMTQDFYNWAFNRHHNKWSWYIRPLFLIPFSYFAYKRNIFGVSIVIFLLLTSMFWFSAPEVLEKQVEEFLLFEKEWLQSKWSFTKLISLLAIPISLFLLALAFWKRSLYLGLAVIILMIIGKVIWSLQNAGASSFAIILPAIIGLMSCVILIIIGHRKLINKEISNKN